MTDILEKIGKGLVGLFAPTSGMTEEEKRANKKFYDEWNAYRRIIFRWILTGTDEALIKAAGLWDEEALVVLSQSAGGGGGGGGFFSIIPSFTPSTQRINPAHAFVTRVERFHARASLVEEGSGGSEVRRNEILGQMAGQGDAPVPVPVQPTEDEMKRWTRVREGTLEERFLSPEERERFKAWSAQQGGARIEPGASAIEIKEGKESKEAGPVEPWRQIFPELIDASRPPPGSQIRPQFIDNQYRASAGGKSGQSKAHKERKAKFEEAVKARGGVLVKGDTVKRILKALVGDSKFTSSRPASENTEQIGSDWSLSSPEERQAIVNAFTEAGIDLNSGTPLEIARRIYKNRSELVIIARAIQAWDPIIGFRPEVFDPSIDVKGEELYREPTAEEVFAPSISEIRTMLEATGMSRELIEALPRQIADMSVTISQIIHRSGADAEEARQLAFFYMYQAVEAILQKQAAHDRSFTVNPQKVLEVVRLAMQYIPNKEEVFGVVAASMSSAKSASTFVAEQVRRTAAKSLKAITMKAAREGKEPSTASRRALDEIINNANAVASILNDLSTPTSGGRTLESLRGSSEAGTSVRVESEIKEGMRAGSEARSEVRVSNALINTASEAIARQAVSGHILFTIRGWRAVHVSPQILREYEEHKNVVKVTKEREEKTKSLYNRHKTMRNREEWQKAVRQATRARKILEAFEQEMKTRKSTKRDDEGEQRYIERQRRANMETDELDEKHGEPEQPGPPRTPRQPGGGGGGPPGPPDEPPHAVAIVAPDGREWVYTFIQIRDLLLKIIALAIGGGAGVHYGWNEIRKLYDDAATAAGLAREKADEMLQKAREWSDNIMQIAQEGYDIVIDVGRAQDAGELPRNGDLGAGAAEPEESKVAPGGVEPINIERPPRMIDNSTYAYGIDGRPKLFPQPADSLLYDPEATNALVPYIPPEVPRYKVTSPTITDPGAKPDLSKDLVKGFDTSEEDIVRFVTDNPHFGDLVYKFNATSHLYNEALRDGDMEDAKELRSELIRIKEEIDGEARMGSDVVTTRQAALYEKVRTYMSKSKSGKSVEVLAHRQKSAHTKALGLDKQIDLYNNTADQINRARLNDADIPRALLLQNDAILADIKAAELNPAYSVGGKKAKLIQEKYPKEVRELADKALNNEVFTLTQEQEALLREYPELGNPVLEYAEFRKHYPDPKTSPSENIEKALGAVDKARESGYKLPVSERPFNEGLHTAPPTLQKVIDRLADNAESGTSLNLSDEERAEIAKYPWLEAKVDRYEEDVKGIPPPRASRSGRPLIAAWTPERVAVSQAGKEFREIRDSGYKIREPIASSVQELDTRIANDRAEAARANAALRNGIASGAPRHILQRLYAADQSARARLHTDLNDIEERGTFLSNRSRERLPNTPDEIKRYERLQLVESKFQENPGALREYNSAVDSLDVASMTRDQYYQKRLQLLEEIAERNGLATDYQAALAADPNKIPEDDLVVNIPDDSTLGMNAGEGTERARTIDPDDQKLFMTSEAESKKQFNEWSHFSYVEPGFGLGGPARNPLVRANLISDAARFAHCRNVPAYGAPSRPMPAPRPDPRRRQKLIPIYENQYGPVHFQDAFHNDYVDEEDKRVIWSNPFGDTNATDRVRMRSSIYEPDYTAYEYQLEAGTPYGRHAVPIGEVSKPAEYWGTDARYYQTNGFDYADQDRLNLFKPGGLTMITKDRAGLADRGLQEPRSEWRHYGRTHFRSNKL